MTSRRQVLKQAIERDAARIQRREKGNASFWRSIGILGAVGWPIVLLAAGGGLLGQWLDHRLGTSAGMTLGLVVIGALAGSAVAWHIIKDTRA